MLVLFTVEYNTGSGQLIVYDWENKKDSIFTTYYEAKIARHRLFNYYKQQFSQYKYKFRDFKIYKYIKECETRIDKTTSGIKGCLIQKTTKEALNNN